MIVDHTGGLHKGIDDLRADKGHASLFQVLREGIALCGTAGNFFEGFPLVNDRLMVDKLPDVFVK